MAWRLRILTLTPLGVLVAAAAASHFGGVKAVVWVVGAALSVAAVAVALTTPQPPKVALATFVGVGAAALTTTAVLLVPSWGPTRNIEPPRAWPATKPTTASIPAMLRSADLQRADLSAAVLIGADLSGADLRGADLSGADLRGACLRGANLAGVNWSGTRYDGADFKDAIAPPKATVTASQNACAIP